MDGEDENLPAGLIDALTEVRANLEVVKVGSYVKSTWFVFINTETARL